MTTEYKTVTRKVTKTVEVDETTEVVIHTLQSSGESLPDLDRKILFPGITDEHINKILHLLGDAFHWGQTSEGATYWCDVVERLQRLRVVAAKEKRE